MEPKKEQFTFWHGLLLAESAALLISLATILVPNKSGSDYSFADHFFDNPTFTQEFFVNFLMTNALIGLLAAFCYIWLKFAGKPR